jgi:hypothetical protein
MAKSKSKSTKRRKPAGAKNISWGGAYSPRKRRRDGLIAGAVVVAVALGVGFAWWRSADVEAEFQALAAEGRGALKRVRTQPTLGGGHLAAGQDQQYADRFPTSGPHDATWTRAGSYTEPRRPTQLVHALEHGNIVIYYERPGAEVLEQIEAWAGLYDGQWDGVVVTVMPGLDKRLMLTAWTKRLELESFDEAAAAAFIDAFRGRGPEHPVR